MKRRMLGMFFWLKMLCLCCEKTGVHPEADRAVETWPSRCLFCVMGRWATGESVLCRGKLLDPAEKLKLERLRQEEADLKAGAGKCLGCLVLSRKHGKWVKSVEQFTLRVSMCLFCAQVRFQESRAVLEQFLQSRAVVMVQAASAHSFRCKR